MALKSRYLSTYWSAGREHLLAFCHRRNYKLKATETFWIGLSWLLSSDPSQLVSSLKGRQNPKQSGPSTEKESRVLPCRPHIHLPRSDYDIVSMSDIQGNRVMRTDFFNIFMECSSWTSATMPRSATQVPENPQNRIIGRLHRIIVLDSLTFYWNSNISMFHLSRIFSIYIYFETSRVGFSLSHDQSVKHCHSLAQSCQMVDWRTMAKSAGWVHSFQFFSCRIGSFIE